MIIYNKLNIRYDNQLENFIIKYYNQSKNINMRRLILLKNNNIIYLNIL